MAADQPILDIRGLRLEYDAPGGRITALNGIDLEIPPGRAVALVGESGSGKSTAALAVMDLLPAEATIAAGEVRFHGEDVRRWSPAARADLRGDRIGIVFQDPFTTLNPGLRIGFQVAEPLIQHRGMSQRAALSRARELLGEVGIPRPNQIADAYPHQLSGGMQQRVLIATALACEPELLVLDEPTTALDVTIEAQILDLVREIQARRHLSVLFITHNLGVVNALCDDVCVLYAGHVVERGPVSDVLADPAHPYTKGLMASLPEFDGMRGELPAIPGRLPDLASLPAGCVFRPRCPFAEGGCEFPQDLHRVGDAVDARCWRAAALKDTAWPHKDGAPHEAGDPADTGDIVRVTGLHKHFGGGGLLASLGLGEEKPAVRAVNGVDLRIGPGETLGLVGESGSGKSTFGRCLLQLTPPSAGTVEIAGIDVTNGRRRDIDRMRRHAQIVFQNPDSSLNPRKRVGQTLNRALQLFSDLDAAGRKERVTELLEMVGLPAGYAERFPHQLSGGEKQRVGIARALAPQPEFLVCDEAVSALDVSVQATILNLFAALRRRLSLSYLFISHDLSVVAHLSDRIAVMYAGQVVEEGRTMDVLEPPYHPYTEALLSAIPVADPRVPQGERIRLTSGTQMNQSDVTGCPFHPRCPHKVGTICETDPPPVHRTEAGHRIACHIAWPDLTKMPRAAPLQAARPGDADEGNPARTGRRTSGAGGMATPGIGQDK